MEPSGRNGDGKPAPGDSIEQRRDALRRVGRAAAAAGVASPMAALATGSGKQWACNPPKTNKVHATISGCKSVLMSGQTGNQCFGKKCTYYKDLASIPSSCTAKYWNNGIKTRAKYFKEIFVCTGMTDSHGKRIGESGCYFDMGIDALCAMTTPPKEAHWAAAYCNSASFYSAGNFPYATNEIQGHWSNQDNNAYCFYTDFMEAV